MVLEYYRLTKPGIIRANVLTACAAFLYASRGDIDTTKLIATIVGTSLLVACGCILNNIMDVELDKKMKRTQNRALVTGKITFDSARRFAWTLGLAGLLTLLIFTNALTMAIGALAVYAYVVVYGWAKRRTNYATEIGTLPGAASIVAGYTAVTGSFTLACFCLFLIMVTWQVAHFLAITLYRSDDYKAARISVLPLRIGAEATQRRIMLYILFYIFSLIAFSILGNVSLTLMFVVIGTGMYWLYRSLYEYQQRPSDKWGRRVFFNSLLILLIFCVMISIDVWLP